MALETDLTTANDVATVVLKGELDGASAPAFRDKIDEAFGSHPTRLVLELGELEYIASAGIRVLVYAKQKLGASVDIYVVAPQEQVLDTMQKTGLERSVIIVDTYDPA